MNNKIRKFQILFIVVISSLVFMPGLNAQNKYWVVFKDKKDVSFNPYAYFDARTIEKRKNLGLNLVSFSDFPLNKNYCECIGDFGKISTQSRWLNAVCVKLKESDLEKVQSLSFVEKLIKTGNFKFAEFNSEKEISPAQTELLKNQIEIMGASLFKEKNINGKGVRIAVFDGGFPGVDSLSVFSQLRDEGRIIATYDFVNKKEFVYDFNSHGTSVLACITGELGDKHIGMATGAEFLLARTEVKPEIFEEEENWAAAVEWADKNGADIISSSLGYTSDRYFPKQMDGKSVFVSRMANMAAGKGILVVNAAGNDGNKDWEVISAPGDADSVLTVGGISSNTGYHINFSSYGPTADGRMKPNVVAFGDVVTSGKNSIKTAYGTSFSTPLVSGFAACVMQLHPEWNNMKVFEEIQKSGSLYPYYDYAHGYGVPQAAYFTGLKNEVKPSYSFEKLIDNLEIKLIFDVKEEKDRADGMKSVDTESWYLYYHIADKETGMIRKYALIDMSKSDSFDIPFSELKKGEVVRAHLRGYTNEYVF